MVFGSGYIYAVSRPSLHRLAFCKSFAKCRLKVLGSDPDLTLFVYIYFCLVDPASVLGLFLLKHTKTSLDFRWLFARASPSAAAGRERKVLLLGSARFLSFDPFRLHPTFCLVEFSRVALFGVFRLSAKTYDDEKR